MITAFDADAGGVETVEAAEPADAAEAPEPDYSDMVRRCKYFELHAPTLSGAIEKFANPVNKNWDVHDPQRDRYRYESFYRKAREHRARVEVRSAVPHEALPSFSAMLEMYEKFELTEYDGDMGREFYRNRFFAPDGQGGEIFYEPTFNEYRGFYDRMATDGAHLITCTPRSALPGTREAKRLRSD